MILTEEEFEQAGWFDVKVLPLDGRGLAPLAYLFRWSNKSVLISGRIPVKLTKNTLPQLLREMTISGTSKAYMMSLQRLEQLKPELWLPALPVYGQNANLYDDDWPKVLAQNRRLAQ